MTSERKPSFDVAILNDTDMLGCAAAAAAGAIAGIGIPAVTICEESIEAAVIAATTVTTDSSISGHVLSDNSGGDEPYFMTKDSDGTSTRVSIMHEEETGHRGNEVNLEVPSPTRHEEDIANVPITEEHTKEIINTGDIEALSSPSIQRDRFESWGGLSDLSLSGMGSLLDDDATAAAALAASALHHTGIIDDITAAAASIDLPPQSVASSMASVTSETTDFDHHSLSQLMLPPVKPDTNLFQSYRSNSFSINISDDMDSFQRPRALSALSTGSHSSKVPHLKQHQQQYISHTQQISQSQNNNESLSSDSFPLSFDLKSLVAAAVSAANVKFHESTNFSKSNKSNTSKGNQSCNKKRKKDLSPDKVTSISETVCDVATLAALKVQEAMHGSKRKMSLNLVTNTILPNVYNKSMQKKSHFSNPPRINGSTNEFPVPHPINMKDKQKNSYQMNGLMSSPHLDSKSLSSMSTPMKLDFQGSNISSSIHNDVTPIHTNKKFKSSMVSPSNIKYPTMMHTPLEASLRSPAINMPNNSLNYSSLPSKPVLTGRKKNMSGNGASAYSVNSTPKGKGSSAKIKRDNSHTLGSPSGGTGQSNQKWEDMFACLLKYVEEVRESQTKGMTPEGQKMWEWGGNVPTTYKTKDGRALGRWINNQRSAKNKGSLKKDRELRLVSTGLKWSVLSTNAWPDMMNELRIYVADKTKNGQEWDGNVPTNYRIKSNIASDGTEIDEEKNLGRWINRQRSLYQGGRLKKERQLELEKIGLKWSVLSTTSWETMYDALCLYAKKKRENDSENKWDGNVPANYKTDDMKSLGRWVNRQRSAYAKQKLKPEWINKLNLIGLKWSVHERKNGARNSTDTTTNRSSVKKNDTINEKATPKQNVNLEVPVGTQQISTDNASISLTGTTLLTEFAGL